MPLHLQKCLPHTSFLGFFAAFSSNILPCFGELLRVFYSYNTTTYIDRQTLVPSFWFRRWRPGFLTAGILYNVCMLAYCIYEENVFAVLVAVRIVIGLYQFNDQLWLVKHWVPFFVQKEKQGLMFLRLYLIGCMWLLVVGSTSWSGSWLERNDIFASVYYISIFVMCSSCGLWYVIQGGADFVVKYRFHINRNMFALLSFGGMIFSIVGLIVGDGGGGNLVNTLKYHSTISMIWFGVQCPIAMIVHRYMVVFEELSWKHANQTPEDPIVSSPSLFDLVAEVTNGFVSTSNKVACDVDVPTPSSVEFATTGSIPKDAVMESPSENHTNSVIGDIKPSNEVEKLVEEDGKEEEDLEVARSATISNKVACDVDVPSSSISNDTVVVAPPEHHTEDTVSNTERTNEVEKYVEEDGNKEGDLEAACGLVSQSATVTACDIPSVINPLAGAPIRSRVSSIVIFYQARRRNALAFDGIIRSASMFRRTILTNEIMMVKLKRHELVCIEVDKLFCIAYQMFLWETVMWLAQIFLALYLQSVNTPTLPATKDGYYCQTPLENSINSAQFVNDLVFARR